MCGAQQRTSGEVMAGPEAAAKLTGRNVVGCAAFVSRILRPFETRWCESGRSVRAPSIPMRTAESECLARIYESKDRLTWSAGISVPPMCVEPR